ncbi:MAG: thioredoxin domain-containing protein [Eubacteriales bacterium]|jgi:hypothetical protein
MNHRKAPNELIHEKSPYLLQHAYNPVKWLPWSKKAFDKAQSEDKPVFLSIGYSTCHWCHAMEKDSFEDEDVARALNENYISIKVDREERPDIDHIYMSVCQLMTGQGGWPLTVFMTPDKKPFFAGTYFSKEDRWRRPGLLTVLHQISNAWEINREKLIDIGDQMARVIKERPVRLVGEPSEAVLDKAYGQLKASFDSAFGGFGSAPRFPSPHTLMFLLRYHKKNPDKQALKMVEKTLLGMFKGGLYDHIGSGFSRYSTDQRWLVPHFEKMLYDNALLAYIYLEACQVMKEPLYGVVAGEIFKYVLRELTSPEGGFYSAEDADSEGVEGKFYVWSKKEVEKILGDKEAEAFCRRYDITDGGNFERKNIPNLTQSGLEEASALSEVFEETREQRDRLFQVRDKRVHPARDDKILTSWNGLMIAAMAKGSSILNSAQAINAAVKAAGFILKNLRDGNGRLLARYRDGEPAVKAYLDDYAFFIWGLLELYGATFEAFYLEEALALTEQMVNLFWDTESGGFFFTGNDAEALISRPKEIYDGAMPSGNSVAAYILSRLAFYTGNQRYKDLAWNQMRHYAGEVSEHPAGYAFLLTAWQFALWPPRQIIVVAGGKDNEAEKILGVLKKEYLPEAVIIFFSEERNKDLLSAAPYLGNYRAINGKTTAYLCEDYSCREPVTETGELLKIIKSNPSVN